MAFQAIYTTQRYQEMAPFFEVVVDGTLLSVDEHARVTSLEVEESQAKKSTLVITYEDFERQQAHGPLYGSFFRWGSSILIRMGYAEEFEERGPFIVEEIEDKAEGLGLVLTIRCSAGASLSQTSHRRVFSSGSAYDLLARVAKEHNYTLTCVNQQNVIKLLQELELSPDTSLVQAGETDGQFLQRVAREFGLGIRTTGRELIVSPPTIDMALDSLLFIYGSADANLIEMSAKIARPQINYVPLETYQGIPVKLVNGIQHLSGSALQFQDKLDDLRARANALGPNSVMVFLSPEQLRAIGLTKEAESKEEMILEQRRKARLSSVSEQMGMMYQSAQASESDLKDMEKMLREQAEEETLKDRETLARAKKIPPVAAGTDAKQVGVFVNELGAVYREIDKRAVSTLPPSSKEPVGPMGLGSESAGSEHPALAFVRAARRRVVGEAHLEELTLKLLLGCMRVKPGTKFVMHGAGILRDGDYRVETVKHSLSRDQSVGFSTETVAKRPSTLGQRASSSTGNTDNREVSENEDVSKSWQKRPRANVGFVSVPTEDGKQIKYTEYTEDVLGYNSHQPPLGRRVWNATGGRIWNYISDD